MVQLTVQVTWVPDEHQGKAKHKKHKKKPKDHLGQEMPSGSFVIKPTVRLRCLTNMFTAVVQPSLHTARAPKACDSLKLSSAVRAH